MPKVTYEFDLNEEKRELNFFQSADKMYFALDNICTAVCNELNNDDENLSDRIVQLLERIKDESSIIWELEE